MKVQVDYGYDHPMYNLGMNLIVDELIKRGHEVVKTGWASTSLRSDFQGGFTNYPTLSSLDTDTRERIRLYEPPSMPEDAEGVDCSLVMRNDMFRETVKPRFYIEHGCSAVKRQTYDKNYQFFLAFTHLWADYVQREVAEAWQHYMVTYVTGYAKSDAIHLCVQKQNWIRESIRATYSLTKPLVIYFPTYRTDSGMRDVYARNVLINDVYHELADEFDVFVAPHVLEEFELVDIPEDRLIRGWGMDRIHWMAASDLMIGDTSGAVVEYLAFDKPVVQINNRLVKDYFKCRMDPRLWQFRVGEMVYDDLLGLRDCVVRSLEDQSFKNYWRTERRKWLGLIMGPVDGHRCEIIVDHIEGGVYFYRGGKMA